MARAKARLILVCARKGGVGKTTVATTVAAILARRSETLLVDLDNQGSAALALGCDMAVGSAQLLAGEDVELPRVAGLKLDVAPGNSDLKYVPMERTELLRELPHEHIVVDCGASDRLREILAGTKPDAVLIVSEKANLSTTMIAGALHLAQEFTSRIAIVGTKLKLSQVEPFREELRECFSESFFPIRTNKPLVERAHLKQVPLTQLSPSPLLNDIKAITRWL